MMISNNIFHGCAKGIYFSDAYGIENIVANNIMTKKASYGYTWDVGIDVTGNPSGNTFVNNFCGHATEGNAFAYGSGTNYWINNYYVGSGGTLANPDA